MHKRHQRSYYIEGKVLKLDWRLIGERERWENALPASTTERHQELAAVKRKHKWKESVMRTITGQIRGQPRELARRLAKITNERERTQYHNSRGALSDGGSWEYWCHHNRLAQKGMGAYTAKTVLPCAWLHSNMACHSDKKAGCVNWSSFVQVGSILSYANSCR